MQPEPDSFLTGMLKKYPWENSLCDFLSDVYKILWASLIGVKSSHVFQFLYTAVKGGVGGKRVGERERESHEVKALTEWVAQRDHTDVEGASPQTDWAKIQQWARDSEEGTEYDTT